MARNERSPLSILTKVGFNSAPHRQVKRVNFLSADGPDFIRSTGPRMERAFALFR